MKKVKKAAKVVKPSSELGFVPSTSTIVVDEEVTPHPTPYTLHPTPFTLHPTPVVENEEVCASPRYGGTSLIRSCPPRPPRTTTLP